MGNGKPVDLISRVHRDGFSMSVFALFDVFLLALMFTVLSSKFILAPGFAVDLSSPLILPQVPGAALTGGLSEDDISVLNINGKGVIIFDGKIYNEDAFARFMQTYKPRGETLLLKADAGVSAQTLLSISALAKSAGFERVLLAAKAENSL